MLSGLILAAGVGQRIQNISDGRPKSLIEFNGVSMLQKQIDQFRRFGIKDVTIVTGHQHQQIANITAKDTNIRLLFNPFYATSNNIISLWIANALIDNDYICAYADLIYEDRLLHSLQDSPTDLTILIDSSKIEAGHCLVKFKMNRLKLMRKQIDIRGADGRYVGLMRVNHRAKFRLHSALDEALRAGLQNDYYTRAIEFLCDDLDFSIASKDVKNAAWSEMDDEQDYNNILRKVETFFD